MDADTDADTDKKDTDKKDTDKKDKKDKLFLLYKSHKIDRHRLSSDRHASTFTWRT